MSSLEKSVEVNYTIPSPADVVREQFNAVGAMFDELKRTASFIYEIAMKCGTSNEQIVELKANIDSLFFNLNESFFLTAEHIVQELNRTVEPTRNEHLIKSSDALNPTYTISYEELYEKYNQVSLEHVEMAAKMTDLITRFNQVENANTALKRQNDELTNEINELNNQNGKLKTENAELKNENGELKSEKADLEERLRREVDSRVERTENTEEMRTPIVEKNSLVDDESSSVGIKSTPQAGDFLDKAKTAEDFIETFEKLFHNSDEIVQLVKRLSKSTNDSQRQVYSAQLLEKSRWLREILNEVLAVFRKARINPSTLGSDMTAQVAEELKRIYQTLKKVKHNTEKRRN